MPRYQTYGQYDAKNDEFPDSAEKILRANEEMASNAGGYSNDLKDENSDKSNNETKENSGENAKKSFYSTAKQANVREGFYRKNDLASALNGAKGKSKGGSFLKRRAPLLIIVFILSLMGVGIGLSQALMPFHVIESLTEMTDGSFTARQARAPYLLKWVFNMEGEANVNVKTTKYRRSLTTKRMQNRLKTEGIEVDTSGDATVLKYTQPDGNVRTITADDYIETYRNDTEFRNKMNRGGRSFLGRIASHIDLTLANFLNSHNLTKNLFKDWINRVYDAEGQTARLHDLIETRSPKTTGDVVDIASGTEKDADGKYPKSPSNEIDVSESTEKVRTGYVDMISNIMSISTNAVCGTAAVASAMTAAKMVIALTNARGYFSGIAEIKDKAAAGRDTGELDVAAEDLGRPDENGKTANDSEAMKLANSGGNYKVNTSAADVIDYSMDSLFRDSSVLGGIGTSAKWIIGCAAASMTTAAISVIVDIATLGTFSVGKALLGAGISFLAGEAVSLLAQTLAANAKSNFCTAVAGPARGACMYLGAANYNGLNFQNGGGSPATREKAEKFYDSYKIALADEAELIRSTKSPFDLSSSHTFLGSIVAKISTLATAMPSLTNIASTLVNTASTSLAALLPTAAAFDKTAYFDSQVRYDCPNLNYGTFIAIGDINCEPVRITDQSMNQIDPEVAFSTLASYVDPSGERSFLLDSEGALDLKNGVEQINPKSLLGKYVKYCAYRNSPFGSVDQNIMGEETGITSSNTLNKLLDNAPIIENIAQLYEGGKQIASLGWSTGANCVARSGMDEISSENSGVTEDAEISSAWTENVKLESWDDFMSYAQVYVEDDRILETTDSSYVSAVQMFMESEGLLKPDSEVSLVEYLAKYSGYTVENMQIALNEVEYWSYIAQYEPEGKGPVVFLEPDEESYDFSGPEQELNEDYGERIAAVQQYVVYAELRNRDIKMA